MSSGPRQLLVILGTMIVASQAWGQGLAPDPTTPVAPVVVTAPHLKWATDAPLRDGMVKVQNALLAEFFPHVHRVRLSSSIIGSLPNVISELQALRVSAKYPAPIRNNLPGTPDFCPLVRRTEALDALLGVDVAEEAWGLARRTAPGLMARAAAFLLLEDSKASYVIEGERPPRDRIQRWGQAIGEAGQAPLTEEELVRLQRIVISDQRFVHMGLRTEGGYVGGRDRDTNAPLPEHIGARPDNLQRLIRGLIAYAQRNETGESAIDPVVAAAVVAFGFVFIHPFEDGNGRIHRWIVHHVLGRRGFNPPGVVFPVSALFLERIERYKAVLEHYSRPRLALTEWETTPDYDVRVLNETIDHFRFFDTTRQAPSGAEDDKRAIVRPPGPVWLQT